MVVLFLSLRPSPCLQSFYILAELARYDVPVPNFDMECLQRTHSLIDFSLDHHDTSRH
jgi:hypothetical protein